MAHWASESRYRAYLLRLWLTSEGEQGAWRVSLEDPHTGERLAFASLERLVAFLQDQRAERPQEP